MPVITWYNGGLYQALQSGIEAGTYSYKCLLVNGYTPNIDTDIYRSDIVSEVSGTGYSAGGIAATATITQNNTTDKIEIVMGSGGVQFSGVTIANVDGAIFYRSTGTASTDNLMCHVAFDSAQSLSSQGLTISPVTTFIGGAGGGPESASTTVAVASSATATDSLTMSSTCALISIQTDKAAWVRVYESAADSAADSGRLRTEDPDVNSGVIAEVITTGAQTINLNPLALASNQESPATAVFPIRVTNDAGTADVAVTVQYFPL